MPGPDDCVQVPVPNTGVLPPKDAEVKLLHRYCVLPTVAVVGTLVNVAVNVRSSIRQTAALPTAPVPP